MQKVKILFWSIFILIPISKNYAQPSTTANDTVPPYGIQFRLGVNPGYHGPNWTDEETAELAAGADYLGIDGVGINAFRIPLPEFFLEDLGYDARVDAFEYYDSLGLKDNTVFLQEPSTAHRDTAHYCPYAQSTMFKNMYAPIWDNGENGTAVNDTNYAALYVYKTVSLYKNQTKFWEVWNEPDLDYSGNGWRSAGDPLSWWDSIPTPCDYKLQTPVYHYIRLLRITYEVTKTLDPDAYITVGGLGFESFLDLIMRLTDNPVDGSVTTDYPLYGGAYFDALSFHSYPHFNGSLRYWDNSCGCFIHTRHSDSAVAGFIDHKDRFKQVLHSYGYDGTTFPEKLIISTETNIPSKPYRSFDNSYDFIGSFEAQRNYGMKLIIKSYAEEIRQLDLYQLADRESCENALHWYQSCGLYKNINNEPYDVILNEQGIGTKTLTDIIGESIYDSLKTEELNLPDSIDGGVFLKDTGDYIIVLWAKTNTDQSEISSATYSLPSSFGLDSLLKKNWNYYISPIDTIVSSLNISLTGNPTFFENPCIANNYFADLDNDGFGAVDSLPTIVCSGDTIPTGFVNNNFDCDDDNPNDVMLDVNDLPIASGLYQANDSISSFGFVDADTSAIIFKSGKTIVLSTGFVAESGSDFLGKIEICSSINPFVVSENPEEIIEDSKNSTADKSELSKNKNNTFTELFIFPNPTKDKTQISFSLEKNQNIEISVYDFTGKNVFTLLQNQFFQKGQHQLEFDSKPFPEGTYFISLKTEQEIITKKLVIIE